MNGIIRASAIAMAVVIAMASVIILTDDSDAYTNNYSLEFEVGQEVDCDLTEITGREVLFLYSGSLPGGLRLDMDQVEKTWYGWKYSSSLRGTLTAQQGTYTFTLSDDSNFYRFTALVYSGECTVTYDAGIGLVNGHTTWSETISKGSYASMPQATHSSGAYTFKGWALSATAVDPLQSYAATADVTLYAVGERNPVHISDATATVTSGQTASLPIHTDPADAMLTITSFGGLSGSCIEIEGRSAVLDMTDVMPGTYHVTVEASYTGYISGVAEITINVPITIVKPIEYVLSEGDLFSYTPVTNPTNASITIDSVKLDGNTVSGFAGLRVEDRAITGTLSSIGTYAVTYTASMEGYVDVTNTVFVKVNERQPSAPAPVMGTISATPRATEPRVYDFVLSGYANVSNIIWSMDQRVFATSSATALYEFPTSGVFTVTCTIAGLDGSFLSSDVDVVCLDNYHREAAWTGISYSYVIEGHVEASVESGSPFSVRNDTVGDREYTVIYGTPSQYDAGSSYRVTAGSESWTIAVYEVQSAAPVADFDIEVGSDGHTVVALFKGQNASFYTYDFTGDGHPEQGNGFTYPSEGRYTIICRAINNVSETSCSKTVSIDIAPSERADVLQLTDFEMLLGEKQDIILAVSEGDIITLSGSAADFVTVYDGTLRVEPTVKGIFDLTVKVHHNDGTSSSKTVKLTVRGSEVQDLEDEKHDYMVIMAVFFIIAVISIAVFVLRDIRPVTVTSHRTSLSQRIVMRIRNRGGRYR